MNRRNFLTALIGTPALAAFLAACGDDTTQSLPLIHISEPTRPY